MRSIFIAVGILLASAAAGASHPLQLADAVYRHGFVYTVDATDSVHQALAVRDGRIVFVGSDSGVKRFIGRATRVIDLHGRMLMPGLVDGHLHPLGGGAQLLQCNLNYEALTVRQFQERIQGCLDKTREREPDAWLDVVAWFQSSMLPAGVAVSAATLDELNTHRPIVVESSFGHTVLANTRAMQLARISATTPDPPGGKIAHEADGKPSGIFEDAAFDPLLAFLPTPTADEDIAAARASLKALAHQGVTSFLDASATPRSLAAFAYLQQHGELTARAHFAPVVPLEAARDPARAVAQFTRLAQRYDQGPLAVRPGMTVRNAKLFLDGVITAPAFTGAMLEPYWIDKGTPGHPQWAPGTNRGPEVYFPQGALEELLLGLGAAGVEPHMHADGDRAVRAGLDAIAALRARFPQADLRAAIAHDESVDPADFKRFAELGAIPVLSLQWGKPASDTIDGARDFLGPARFRVMEPAGFLHDAGARIAYGSDWPVDPLNEWFALQVGLTRMTSAALAAQNPAKYGGRLGDDPGLTRKAVLRAITMNSSYELHQDALTGSLEVGKFADFIVLDRNFMKVPPQQTAIVNVLLTVVGGNPVFLAE